MVTTEGDSYFEIYNLSSIDSIALIEIGAGVERVESLTEVGMGDGAEFGSVYLRGVFMVEIGLDNL